ncbi:hypothetical protein D3C72_1943430 [compost metagenome]
MRRAELGGALDGGHHVLRAVEPVVRVRRDIGPMRLDVRKMQAPGRVALLGDESQGAIRGVGRFGVPFGNACGKVRIPHVPARTQLAGRPLSRIREFQPRVLCQISVAP